MFGVLFWQFKFYYASNKLDGAYTRTDASGLSYQASKQFLYFYYYLNLYPIVSKTIPKDFSKEGAANLLKNHHEDIFMESDFMIMWGDNLKSLMYFPDALISGTTENLSVKTFNSILFIVALLLLLISFFYINKFSLGIILVALLGSNPFQLYEVYANQNLFGTQISVLIILLSINLPLFLDIKRPKYYHIVAMVLSGAIIGTVAHIRVEMLTLLLSCLIIYLFIPKVVIFKKILYAFLFIAIFFITNQAWTKYFDYKYQQASKVVESVGGNISPYANLRTSHHTIWHTLFAGFGDFDKKYNYKWSDSAVYSYAEPILKNQGVLLPRDKEVWSVMPEYQKVIRSKVISQIREDPGWYANILYSRLGLMLEKNVPITMLIGDHIIKFIIPKILLICMTVALLLFLIIIKNYFLLKLFLFSFPQSLTILLIYSARNVTSISVFHIFCFAIYFYLALILIYELGSALLKRQKFKTTLKVLLDRIS